MALSSYENGLIHGAMYAARHFSEEPIANFDKTTQEEKDFCLYSCPYTDNCTACDTCDGKGNLKRMGRPRKMIDIAEILQMAETMTITAICLEKGISRPTVYKAIRSMA